jgi:hypothetical protein
MKVVYRDSKGRFARATRKTVKQFSYDDNWKLLDVADSFYTKQQTKKIEREEELSFSEQVVKRIRRVSIRKPKTEKFEESLFFTRRDNSDLFSFLKKRKLDEQLKQLSLSHKAKGKVMVAEVITTIGERKQERIVSRQFKLTHLGKSLEFVSGKRKGKKYSMADHVAHFIHDSVNEHISDERQQFTLYSEETYGKRQREERRSRKDRKRIARNQQTFQIRVRFIPKGKAKTVLDTRESLARTDRRRTAKAKRSSRK